LLELVEAAAAGGDLVPAVQTIVRKLGFDGFLYASASYHLRPNNDERHLLFHDAAAGLGGALRPTGVRGVRSEGSLLV
jgi:hypothetical protein